jgi:hypothetical protein
MLEAIEMCPNHRRELQWSYVEVIPFRRSRLVISDVRAFQRDYRPGRGNTTSARSSRVYTRGRRLAHGGAAYLLIDLCSSGRQFELFRLCIIEGSRKR